MADINKYIYDIRTAKYGDEVRESIVQALIAVNGATEELKKTDTAQYEQEINSKVLSSNLFTDEDKQRIANLEDGKVDKVEGKGLSTNDFTDEEKQRIVNLEDGKVDKIDGKVLSSNDFTDESKLKLDSIDMEGLGFYTIRSDATGIFPNWTVNFGRFNGDAIFELMKKGKIPMLFISYASKQAYSLFIYSGVSATVTQGEVHYNVMFAHDCRSLGSDSIERLQINYDGTVNMDMLKR